MNIKLNINERIQLINLLNEFKGNISGLYKIIKLMDQIEISDKDKKAVDFKLIPAGNGMMTYTWDKRKEKEKGVELDDGQIGFVKQIIEAKNEKNEFTIGDKITLSIAEKLGIKFDENTEPAKEDNKGKLPK